MFSCHGQVRYVKRVFMSNTGEPYRIYRQRWPFFIDAIEGYPGSDNACYLYSVHNCIFQG